MSIRKPLAKPSHRQRTGVIAALDIGTSKIACLIADHNGTTGPVVKGIGQHASHGMRNGEVVDIEALSSAVGKTVEAAENMAGRRHRPDKGNRRRAFRALSPLPETWAYYCR